MAKQVLAVLRMVGLGLLVGAALPLVGCPDPSPFPYGITKLGVLPAWSPTSNSIGSSTLGEQLSAAILRRTSFRVVGASSTRAMLALPENLPLANAMRSEALSYGHLSFDTARAMGRRLNVQALLASLLRVNDLGLQGGGGSLSLELMAFDAESGARIWGYVGSQAYGVHPTRSQALGRALAELVERSISALPRPAGEAPEARRAS